MYLLENRVQEYAWGSRTAIAELLGHESPAPRPQAELWLGAHPRAPSRVERAGKWQSLLDVISAAPEAELGVPVVSRFGAALPFLFKVLAAETPLSLQAHPNAEQARAGYDREELERVPLEAPRRNYRDRNHKPELLCALGPFEALSGFRRAKDTARLLDALRIDALTAPARALEREANSDGLREIFQTILSTTGKKRSELVRATIDASARHVAEKGEFSRECNWALRIGALYPDDVGVTVALLLNLVRLEPGEAIYLAAGNLHAYLKGVGIEIMANSDNVIRGGLTPKHVDVGELLRVLTFEEGPATLVDARENGGPERIYETPTTEFCLSAVELRPGLDFRAYNRNGPEILLCTEGSALLSTADDAPRTLAKGASVFVSASTGAYAMNGNGTVFRATVGRRG